VSFVSPDTEAHWRLIEKRQNISVPREVLEGFAPQEPLPAKAQVDRAHPVAVNDPNGGIKGKRPNKKDKLRMAQALASTTDSAP
jgi:hypothetical protein